MGGEAPGGKSVVLTSLLVDFEITFASLEGVLGDVVRRVSSVSSEYTSRKNEYTVMMVVTCSGSTNTSFTPSKSKSS